MQTQAETRGKSTDLGLRWGKNLQEWGGERDKGGKGKKTGVRKLKVKKETTIAGKSL